MLPHLHQHQTTRRKAQDVRVVGVVGVVGRVMRVCVNSGRVDVWIEARHSATLAQQVGRSCIRPSQGDCFALSAPASEITSITFTLCNLTGCLLSSSCSTTT